MKEDPKWVDQIFHFGRHALTVAATNEVLAVGTNRTIVTLHGMSTGFGQKGEIETMGRVSGVAFHNGLLWVLGHQSNFVEIFDVTDPENPVKVGDFTPFLVHDPVR